MFSMGNKEERSMLDEIIDRIVRCLIRRGVLEELLRKGKSQLVKENR